MTVCPTRPRNARPTASANSPAEEGSTAPRHPQSVMCSDSQTVYASVKSAKARSRRARRAYQHRQAQVATLRPPALRRVRVCVSNRALPGCRPARETDPDEQFVDLVVRTPQRSSIDS